MLFFLATKTIQGGAALEQFSSLPRVRKSILDPAYSSTRSEVDYSGEKDGDGHHPVGYLLEQPLDEADDRQYLTVMLR